MTETISNENDNDIPEDDEELILDGSELHNYLKSCGFDDINVYKHKTEAVAAPENTEESLNLKEVPACNMKLIKMILNSSLLMEEDASYLFKISNEYTLKKESFMYSKECASALFLLGILSAVVYFYFGFTQSIFLPAIISSLLSLVPMAYSQYTCMKYERSLRKLLETMDDLYLLLRKIIRNIAEDECLMTSKELALKLRGDAELIDLYKHRKSLPEVTLLISRTMSLLKHLIIVSRIKIFSIVKLWKPDDFKYEKYVSLCTDDQLGINTSTEVPELNTSCLTVLDNLKNIYLIMQSECLRILGLCLLEHNYSKLYRIVNSYKKETLSAYNSLQIQYNNFFSPKLCCKENSKHETTMNPEYFVIHDICLKIRSMFVDMRQLCEFMESNNDIYSNENLTYINSTLSDVEKELSFLSERVQSVKTKLLKISPKMPMPPDISESETVLKTESKGSSIPVGFSDFSVRGEDEVFLGSSSDDTSALDACDLDLIEDRFDPPSSLISELKIALIKKKDEFEQREIKALKSDEEIEAYKSCSSPDLLTLPTQNKTPEQPCKSYKPTRSTKSEISFLESQKLCADPVLSGGAIQKNIAVCASNISLNWNAMKSVDYFEDDLSDDEET